MRFSNITLLVACISAAAAAGKTWKISVGQGDHNFRPDIIQADVGDTIEFDFFPANHSVVRAEYQFPCIPYELTGKGKVGFFSGFHPVDAILADPPKWTIRINDTDPIFFYCSAPSSCINYQMIGVINPNASVSLVTQKSLAASSKYMLQPGDMFPTEDMTPTAGTTSNTASSSSKSSSTAGMAMTMTMSNSLPGGAIAGIVVGAICIMILGATVAYFIGRSKKTKKQKPTRKSFLPVTAYGGKPDQLSVASPPAPLPFDPGKYRSGTVYIPIKATDFAEYNRQSASEADVRSSTPVGGTQGLVPAERKYGHQMLQRGLEERQVWPPVRTESPLTRHELSSSPARFGGK